MPKAKKTRAVSLLEAKVPTGPLTDEAAQQLQKQLAVTFKDAIILPKVGLPSQDNGIALMMYTLNNEAVPMAGVRSKSPFLNSGIYSVEVNDGRWANYNSVMLPNNKVSAYANALKAAGFDVTTGTSLPGYSVVTSTSNANPTDFIRQNIAALDTAGVGPTSIPVTPSIQAPELFG